jgi:AcrR family transcriptional regulator
MEAKNIGPGRPKGTGRDTKSKIGKIASKQFSEIGYEKTTIRSVAEASGVDPKLVMHYFGNKEKLFASTMSLPHEAAAAMTLLSLVPKRQWGSRISDLVWLSKKAKSNKVMVGIIRASASEDKAAEMLREFYAENLFNPMLAALKVDNQEIRSVMLSSLMVGYTFNNEILDLFEHLGVSDKKTKALFAKTVQTILTTEI